MSTKHNESPHSAPPPHPEDNRVAFHWHNFINRLHTDRNTQILVVMIGALSIVVIATISVLFMFQPNAQAEGKVIVPKIDVETDVEENSNEIVEEPRVEPIVENEPLVIPRHIDGLVVARDDANKVPACIMIENAAFDGVRPQSGLSAASVVYEVIVEGGITRWMAVFAGEHANIVGPVRSARDTYLEFASEYNCAYLHAGGSFTALQALQNFGMRDIDGLRESKWFWRDPNKYAPHNFFTNTDNAYEAISSGHSWTDTPTYDSWKFADETDLAELDEATATEINIYLGGAYDVRYVYNTEGKYYERWNGGVLSIDANNGDTIKTRNIIIQKVPPGVEIEGKSRINFSVTGEGEVYIFRNGQFVQGTWKKADRLGRTKFYDANGNEIPLARGTTWVEIVPETHTFDWK